MQGSKTFFISLLLMLIYPGISAQDTGGPTDLVTDRPDQTESSISVPHHALQIETGFLGEFRSYGPVSEVVVEYGSTLLRYGVLKGMELRLAMDYSTLSDFGTTGPGSVIGKGMSPVVMGAKIDLTEQRGWIPEMAIIVHVNIPVFSSDFSIDYAVPDIILAASHTISSNFSLGYNLGIEWADNNESSVKKYALVAGFALTERIGMFVESFGSYSGSDFMNMIDGGLTYLILPNLQYDISGGMGVTASSPDFFISTGLSWRIPQ